VPEARLADHPVCSARRAPFFAGVPVARGAARFPHHPAESERRLLVDTRASWCGPCRSIAPQFEAPAAVPDPHMRLAQVPTSEARAIAARAPPRPELSTQLTRELMTA
jgi:thioredoxin 2